jgi:hypothetical protein
MSADQRNFTDFEEFPGKIIKGIHTFPILWHNDGADRQRKWCIYVRLIRIGAELSGIDWDTTSEKQIKIHSDYYQVGTQISDTVAAEVWSETGILEGKITRNAPTYFTLPLNLGKANERNVFQTALIMIMINIM